MKKSIFIFLIFAVSVNAQYKKTFQAVTLAKDTAITVQTLTKAPLFFYCDSQSVYNYKFELQTTSSATTGIEYTLVYPVGSTITGELIGTKKADTLATAVLTTDSTASVAFNTNSSGTYPITISGTIFTGSNRGIVQLEFVKPTSGTATLKKGGKVFGIKN